MSTDVALVLLRELIRSLLDALLRPVFLRMREDARHERRFLGLLNACDCHPFCVEIGPHGLWILDQPSDDHDRGFWEDAA